MNRFHLPQAVVEQLGWVLVHSVWQLALIALVTLVLTWAMQRASARARYAMLLVALATMTLSPVATLLALPRSQPAPAVVLVPGEMISVETPVGGAPSIEAGPTIVFPDARAIPDAPVFPATPAAPAAAKPPRLWEAIAGEWSRFEQAIAPRLDWIVGLWCVGVCLFALRPAIGLREIGRLRRVGVSPVADNIAALLCDLARRLGLARRVAILESARVKVPLVVGHLRPLILLPVSLTSQMPVAQLEAILAHELAHVRRHDYLVNLWQTLVETVLFYHPAVWWLSRRVRQERENCCDDLAVAVVENRVEYGRALLAVAELQAHPAALALGVRGGSLPARIARLFPGQRGSHAIDSGNLVVSGVLLSAMLVLTVWATAVAHQEDADKPDADASEIVAEEPAAPNDEAPVDAESEPDYSGIVATRAEHHVDEEELRTFPGNENDREALLALQKLGVEVSYIMRSPGGPSISPVYNTLEWELDFTESWRGKAEDWKLLEALDRPERVELRLSTTDLSGLERVKPARPFGEIRASDLPAVRLARLDRLPPCRWLSIDDEKLKLADYAKLIALAADVEELTVPWRRQEEIADAVVAEIAAKMKHLVRLDFTRPLSGPGLKSLARLASLRHLSIRTAKIVPADVEPLARLTHLETLKIWPLLHEMEASDRRPELPVGDALCRVAARLPELRVLTLNTLVGPEGVESLAGAKNLLAFDGEMTEVDDRALAAFAGMFQLRRLQLTGEGKLSPAGFAKVEALVQLTDLALPATGLTDQALTHLRPLKKLLRLGLRGGTFQGTGFAGGAGGDSFLPKLVRLDISGSQFNDDGCRSLASGCPKLDSIDLAQTKITDAGLKTLAETPSVGTMNLTGTKITDAGLAHFQKPRTSWAYLWVPETGVTAKGLAALSEVQELVEVENSDEYFPSGVWMSFEIHNTQMPPLITAAGATRLTDEPAVAARRMPDVEAAEFAPDGNTPAVADGEALVGVAPQNLEGQDEPPQTYDGQIAHQAPHFIANDDEIRLMVQGSQEQQVALLALRKLGVTVFYIMRSPGGPSISPAYDTAELQVDFGESWQGSADDWKLLEALDRPERVNLMLETTNLAGLEHVKTARPFCEIRVSATSFLPAVRLARLDRWPACRWLDIRDDKLTVADYAKLTASAGDVEELTVPWRFQEEIADAVVAEIAAKMKHLVRLDFNRPVSATGIKSIAQLASLRHLSIRTAKIEPADVEPLARLTHLETLNIGPSPHGPELPVGDALCRVAARLPELRVLTLYRLIGPEGVKSLVGAKKLLALDAEMAEVDDGTLAELAAMTQLHRLQLAGEGKLSPAGFAKVEQLRRLSDLALPGAGLTDKSLEHLRPLTKLKRLSLRGGTFNGTGFVGNAPVGSPSFLANLDSLDISGSEFNDEGCRALARDSSKHLALDLSETQISDAGLKSLAAMTGLTALYLQGTKTTDAGLAHFKGAKSQYIHLFMVDTAVTEQGVAALHAAKPDVDVAYHDDQRWSRMPGVWSTFGKQQMPAAITADDAAQTTERSPFVAEAIAEEDAAGEMPADEEPAPVTAAPAEAPAAPARKGAVLLEGSKKEQAALEKLQALGATVHATHESPDDTMWPGYTWSRLVIEIDRDWTGSADDWKLLEALDRPEELRLEVVGGEHWKNLANVRFARPIAALNLSSAEPLAEIERLPECRALFVFRQGLTLADGRKLIALAPNIEALYVLESNRATAPNGDAFAADVAVNMKHLKWLALYEPLSRAGLESIGKMTGLKQLRISPAHSIEPADVEPLAQLTNLQALCVETLDNEERRTARQAQIPVGDALARVTSRLPALQSVIIEWRMSERGLAAVASIKKLQSLELELRAVDDQTMRVLAPLVELRELHLGGAGMLSPAGLALVERLRALVELVLPGDGLDDAALGSLNSLTELKTLTLRGGDFSGTGFGGTGLVGAGPTRPLAKLESLDLSGSQFNDAGCMRLAQFCPKLETLKLSGTQVTAAGLKPLARLPNLAELKLDRTDVSDGGLDALQQITRLRKASGHPPYHDPAPAEPAN